MENPNKRKLIITILGGIALYLASTGISYATFRYLGGPVAPGLISPVPVEEARFRVDPTAPKTEACPLNGMLYTKGEKDIWEKRRPLTVMIENHAEARLQSGLSRADIVYEAVAEGGITRLMAVYYCGASAQDLLIGPVRSARIYYVDFASEYGDYPLHVHVGGANDFSGYGDTHPKARALEQIQSYGWARYNDIDHASISHKETIYKDGTLTFWRDYERLPGVATEHTMYSTTDKLWWIAETRGLTYVDEDGNRWNQDFISWKFKKEGSAFEKGEVDNIKFNFWSGYKEYEVNWQYDREANHYLRFNGGQSHKDKNNEEQLKAKVVIVQFMRETGPIDRNKHLLYTTTGTGKAIIFQDGQAIQTTWTKTDRKARTKFTAGGKEIELNPGPIWIEIVPAGKEVSY